MDEHAELMRESMWAKLKYAVLFGGLAAVLDYSSLVVNHLGNEDMSWAIYTPVPLLAPLSLGYGLASIFQGLFLAQHLRSKGRL